MELLQPRITLQNIEDPHWLVTYEHDFDNGECVVFTVKVPQQTERSVPFVLDGVLSRAIELLELLRVKNKRS